MSDENGDIYDRDDKSHLTGEQRIADINTRAGNLVDRVEELSDWEPHPWEPPTEGPKSNTTTIELTTKEAEAIERAVRRRAGEKFDERGDNPTYRKYAYLTEKFGGRELTYHESD